MKRILIILLLPLLGLSCSSDQRDPDRFRNGTFEIPEGKGYEKTIIIRTDSIQVEKYAERTDTLKILWKDNFNYTLYMLHPRSAIDEEPIHVRITRLKRNSYDFEAVIGHSNYVQKGSLYKIYD